MKDFYDVLTNEERVVYALRKLYALSGYSHYKMSKFEEYELYVKNKDFLVSDSVITFTDTDGRLMALKPDVTLSIIKNTKDSDGVNKLYYNENVYRVSKGTRSFKEIMQAGLECIGDIGINEIVEVLQLAIKSLKTVSNDTVLEISHLDVVNAILKPLSEDKQLQIKTFLRDKNVQAVISACKDLPKKRGKAIEKLVTTYGTYDEIKNELDNFCEFDECKAPIEQLKTILTTLLGSGNSSVIVDFSIINSNYYNGVAFKGFIKGIPSSVLSGGQYDNLMAKMNRRARAIGFAVYLDEIGKLKGV